MALLLINYSENYLTVKISLENSPIDKKLQQKLLQTNRSLHNRPIVKILQLKQRLNHIISRWISYSKKTATKVTLKPN